MLIDPLYIGTVPATELLSTAYTAGVFSSARQYATIDISPGSSKRILVSATEKGLMTISHSQTKENAPYVTNRSVVRFDLQKVDAAGKTVTLSAFAVIAQPIGGGFTDADALSLARTLGAFLYTGKSFVVPAMNKTVLDDTMSRVLAGEP